MLRLITGNAYGMVSPVRTFSPIFYVDAVFGAGSSLSMTTDHPERAIFVVAGELKVGGLTLKVGDMAVLEEDEAATMQADASARAMLLGGAPLDGGPHHMWWNFVSSSRERINQARLDWKNQKIGKVAGDDEFIPLPG